MDPRFAAAPAEVSAKVRCVLFLWCSWFFPTYCSIMISAMDRMNSGPLVQGLVEGSLA